MGDIHMVFTGHRMQYFPDDITFKNLYKAVAPIVRDELIELKTTGLVDEDGQIIFYVGMADGSDIAAAGGALEAKKEGLNIKVVPAMPYPSFGSSFRDPLMKKYRQVILEERCRAYRVNVASFDPKPTDPKGMFSKLYEDRNRWMVRQAIINQEAGDMALGMALWNGRPSGTANTVKLMDEAEIHWANIWDDVAEALGLVADLTEVDKNLVLPAATPAKELVKDIFKGRVVGELPLPQIIKELEDNGQFPQLQANGTYTVGYDDDPDEMADFTEADLRKMHANRKKHA